MKTKVLVTGGNGFLGRNLIERLVKLPGNLDICYTSHRSHAYGSDFYVESNLFGKRVSCDLTFSNDVVKLFDWFKPEVIFHLAGKAVVKENPFEIMNVNVDATHLLLEHCPDKCRLVLASTVIVHGDLGVKVSDMAVPNTPTSIYGISKLTAEKLVAKYHNDGKVSGRILRLVANVGKHQSHGVCLDFIKKLKSDSEHLEILGDEPGSMKPFVHSSDTAEAFILAAGYPKSDLLVANVSSENEITSLQVAEQVMKATGIVKPIKFLGAAANWKGDNKYLGAHSDKLKYLGWKPKFLTSEEAVFQGVRDIIDE